MALRRWGRRMQQRRLGEAETGKGRKGGEKSTKGARARKSAVFDGRKKDYQSTNEEKREGGAGYSGREEKKKKKAVNRIEHKKRRARCPLSEKRERRGGDSQFPWVGR